MSRMPIRNTTIVDRPKDSKPIVRQIPRTSHWPNERDDTFVNDGPFFDKYPDVYPNTRCFTATDEEGNIVEQWERNKNGRMVDVTQRARLEQEVAKARQNLEKLCQKEDLTDVTE